MKMESSMFSEIAKTLLEFLKLAPRYFIAFGIIAAFMLFASEKLLKQIGVFEFVQNHRSMIGLVLVVSMPLFLVSIFADIFAIIKEWWRKRQYYKSMTKRL